MSNLHERRAYRVAKKKELAQILYTEEGRTQTEIAELLGVSQPNISKFAKRGNWRAIKEGLSPTTKETNLALLNSQLSALNGRIAERDGLPTKEESRILRNLAKTIDTLGRKEKGELREIAETGKKFVEYLLHERPQKALEFLELWDGFLNSKAHRGQN